MTNDNLVLSEVEDGVALVTLNRPEAMNALSTELRIALSQTIDRLEADPDVHIMILTGAGDRAFTAGLDLKELGDVGLGGPSVHIEAHDPVLSINRFSGPIIGAVNGVAITGGFEIALACDFLIASPNARFADTHARVGILPGWGLSQKLSRLIGISRAKELSFTGNFIDADTAHKWGLVNHIVPADQLIETAKKLADDMRSCEPASLKAYRKLINDGYAQTFGEAMETELQVGGALNREVTAQDVERRREAIRARGQKQG